MAQCKFTLKRIRVLDDGCHVVRLDDGEIWENPELISIRDTFLFLNQNMGVRDLGIDLKGIKHLPSGFFGLLYDWYDRGPSVRLLSPEPEIARMLWFRQYFRPLTDNTHIFDASIGSVPCETAGGPLKNRQPSGATGDGLRLISAPKAYSQSMLV